MCLPYFFFKAILIILVRRHVHVESPVFAQKGGIPLKFQGEGEIR